MSSYPPPPAAATSPGQPAHSPVQPAVATPPVAGPPPEDLWSFALLRRSFAQADGLPFADCLDQQRLEELAAEYGSDTDSSAAEVYTPAVTLWAFLSQCLSASKSCVSAVARVLVLRVSLGLPPCSAATGGYCQARAKLPVAFLQRLAEEVADGVAAQVPASWLWKGRRVRIADGTTVSGPDTEANQAEYPQSGNQKPGLGFPLLRLVVLLCLSTAMVQGAACGPFIGKGTGETSLLRQLLDRLGPGDVLVADSYYCVWWLLAVLRGAGVDAVMRLHQTRTADCHSGEVLGAGDHIVTWGKPEDEPVGLDGVAFAALPGSLRIREVLVRVQRRGFRVRQFVVATTLLDAGAYPAEDIAELYYQRWHAELDIRAIKQTLRMDILRGKTPEMLRREIWGHLLGYNLIRQVMAQAALAKGVPPRHLSLAGAVQLAAEFRPALMAAGGEVLQMLGSALWVAIGGFAVGHRPGRREPRKLKRRPKDCKLLEVPRAEARQRLLAGEQED